MLQLRHEESDLCLNKEEPESQASKRGGEGSKCGRTEGSHWKLHNLTLSTMWSLTARQPLHTPPHGPLSAGLVEEAGSLVGGPEKQKLTA